MNITDFTVLILSRVECLARVAVALRASEALSSWLSGRAAWTVELAHDLMRQGDVDAPRIARDENLVLWKVYSWRTVHRAAAALVLLDVWRDRLDRSAQLGAALSYASLASDLAPLTWPEVRAIMGSVEAVVHDGSLYFAQPIPGAPARLDGRGPCWGCVGV